MDDKEKDKDSTKLKKELHDELLKLRVQRNFDVMMGKTDFTEIDSKIDSILKKYGEIFTKEAKEKLEMENENNEKYKRRS